MALEIVWSDEAQLTFDQNIDYLHKEWSEKEVANFILQTKQILKRLETFPESYPTGTIKKRYRKAKLNKYIVLFYHYRKSAKTIELIRSGM